MAKKKIDLTDIKEKSLEETMTFENLMTRSEKRRRKKEETQDDIEEMVKEKRKRTEDLTKTINEIKEKKKNKIQKRKELEEFFNDEDINYSKKEKKVKQSKKENSKNIDKTRELDIKKIKDNENTDDLLSKTQILELTRKMKFNFEDTAKENIENKKNGFSLLNAIGIINLICIGFYIYLLTFSSYQDNQTNYLIAGSIIISLVLFFGISIVANKKTRKIFNILNILSIAGFICFSIYIFLK